MVYELNQRLPDAKRIFCDVYKEMMEIINNPRKHGRGYDPWSELCFC